MTVVSPFHQKKNRKQTTSHPSHPSWSSTSNGCRPQNHQTPAPHRPAPPVPPRLPPAPTLGPSVRHRAARRSRWIPWDPKEAHRKRPGLKTEPTQSRRDTGRTGKTDRPMRRAEVFHQWTSFWKKDRAPGPDPRKVEKPPKPSPITFSGLEPCRLSTGHSKGKKNPSTM